MSERNGHDSLIVFIKCVGILFGMVLVGLNINTALKNYSHERVMMQELKDKRELREMELNLRCSYNGM